MTAVVFINRRIFFTLKNVRNLLDIWCKVPIGFPKKKLLWTAGACQSVLQARCPSCHPTNSVKALKDTTHTINCNLYNYTQKTKHYDLLHKTFSFLMKVAECWGHKHSDGFPATTSDDQFLLHCTNLARFHRLPRQIPLSTDVHIHGVRKDFNSIRPWCTTTHCSAKKVSTYFWNEQYQTD